MKEEDTLVVKASGTVLKNIDSQGFVTMDLPALEKIWEKEYPEDSSKREAEVVKDLMAAMTSEEEKRPSVETLLHAALPQTFVVHTHPPLVNGLTCAKEGEKETAKLFPEALWIETTLPGYTLASVVQKKADQWYKEKGKYPEMIFLENHGLVTAGDTPKEIEELHDHILTTIDEAISRKPDVTPRPIDPHRAEAFSEALLDLLEDYSDSLLIEGLFNKEIEVRIQSEEAFAPVAGQLTPDHMMYYGYMPLFVPAGEGPGKDGGPIDKAAFKEALKEYHRHEEGVPHVVAVEKEGVFVLAESEKDLERARDLFVDALKIAAVAENFGGTTSMPRDLVEFILGWEAKSYQKSRLQSSTE